MWRFDELSEPEKVSLESLPGIEVTPVQPPLQLGDVSSRLRIIDAWTEGKTYKLRVEGRRGRRYQIRMFAPFKLTVEGALTYEPQGPPGPTRMIVVEMPPADEKATGPIPRRADWATKVITIPLGDRLR